MNLAELEKDLLFASLAVRDGYVSPAQISAGVEAYLAGEPGSLGDVLVEQGALTPGRRADVQASVDKVFHDLCATVGLTQKTPDVQLSDDTDNIPQEQAGRYTIQGVHGRGGQARVLLAVDETIGREVALKVLSTPGPGIRTDSTSGSTPGSIRFLREARVTGQLEHPSIVPVHELGRREDGSLYYAMRLVRGETLAMRLRACRDLEERMKLLGVFWDICHAIAYAHSRGVVHRDLKPSNIMVGEFGETVLLDWGVAKVRGKLDLGARKLERGLEPGDDDTDSATVDGSAIGTPAYMSPEQARGEIESIDERSDVWGLGAVLYELLTGRPPFTGSSRASILLKAASRSVRPVHQRVPDAPAELAAIAQKALQREPADRYQNAKELADDVGAYMTGCRVKAYAYSSWELMRRFAAQHKAAFVAAGVVLTVIVGALVFVAISYRNELVARQEEHAERLAANYHLSQAYTEKASRLMEDMRLLSADVFASAALLHNPAHARGPFATEGFEQRFPGSHDLQVAAASLIYRMRLQLRARLEQVFTAGEVLTRPAFSPDGSRLAAGDFDHVLHVWTLLAGPATELPRLGGNVHDVVFSRSGRRLVSGDTQGAIRVWDTRTWEPTHVFEEFQERVYGVAISRDERFVAGGSWDGSVGIHDLETGEAIVRIREHRGRVNAVAFSPDGTRLASCGEDKTVRLFELPTGRPVINLLREAEVQSLDFSPDGRYLASGDEDGHVWIHDFRAGFTSGNFRAHAERVADLGFSPDGRLLATAGYDRTVRLWDVASGRLRLTLDGHRAFVTGVTFSHDGSLLATSSYDKTLRVWRLIPGGESGRFRGHEGLINSVVFLPDGNLVATAGWDNTIRLWDLRSGNLRNVFRGHQDVISGLAVDSTGEHLASASWDKTVRVWSLQTGKAMRVLRGHTESVFDVAFSPDGATLASSSVDKTLRLWTLPSGTLRSVLRGHDRSVYRIAFSPDGRHLASASYDKTTRIWGVETGAEVQSLGGHTDWVSCVDYSPDGRMLATSGKDGLAILWDAATGQERLRLKGHAQWVNEVVFSPDGELVATASDDFTVRVWSRRTGLSLLKIPTRKEAVGVAFSPDGRRIALGDATDLRVYPLDFTYLEADPAGLLSEAETAAGATLDGFRLVHRD